MTQQQSGLRRKAMLVILDGVGVNPSKVNNAVYEANTPRLDEYFGTYAHGTIVASGRAVGLPSGQMGNSEVGHMTLGCGSILRQNLVRISDEIADGSFFENPALMAAVTAAKAANRPLHLLGLVSDGGVHSHIDHLIALVQLCGKQGVKPMVHMITDGRDTSPQSACQYLEPLQSELAEAGGQIATVSGRYFAMDRDKRWDRIKQAWDAMVLGEGEHATDVRETITAQYANGVTDEFLKPTIMSGAEPVISGDQLVFFNFRNDRPRQMSDALALPGFGGFDRGDFGLVKLTTMTEYDPKLNASVCYQPENPEITLAEVVSGAGLKQFHCSETEKYAHVTFFFNGGTEKLFEGEDHKLIPSPNVATYDLQPEMSCEGIADAVVEATTQDYSLIVVNFANGDMVGHTAVKDSIVRGIEALDTQVGRVLDAAVANGFSVVLTADHGNCEEYIDPYTKEPHTQHTTYPVPLLVVDQSFWTVSTEGGLADVAPTLLQLMGLPKPAKMGGNTLLLEEVGPLPRV